MLAYFFSFCISTRSFLENRQRLVSDLCNSFPLQGKTKNKRNNNINDDDNDDNYNNKKTGISKTVRQILKSHANFIFRKV